MILEAVLQNILADTIDAEINTGAGTAELIFETNVDAEVATISLQNPAFGAAAAGVITLQGVPLSDTSATGGLVDQASIYDRDGTKQLEMSVNTTGEDIDMTTLLVVATEQVDLTALTITVPTGP